MRNDTPWSRSTLGLPRVAILGGGQLGKMMAQEAQRMSFPVAVLDPDEHAPALALASRPVVGSYSDLEALARVTAQCDVVTIDIEHVDVEALRELEAENKTFYPQLSVLEIVQDKLLQKNHFATHGIPAPEHREADGDDPRSLGALGFPIVQKTRRAGYDGKGVAVLRSSAEEPLPGPSLIERLVEIDREVAVLVARDPEGDHVVYPPVEMVFDPETNVLDSLVARGASSEPWWTRATELAIETVRSLDAVGIVAVEMFLDTSGELWVNEVAPRPHNSGHHTIEANVTCQFEQHLRAITSIPLGSPRQVTPAAMANLIGEAPRPGRPRVEGLRDAARIPGVSIHIYGKAEARHGRKMGHLTAVAPHVEEALENVRRARDLLRITNED